MANNEPPKKISLSFAAKKPQLVKKPVLPKPINGIKRPHASLHDSDEEDEQAPQHLAISHFDESAGGAITHHSSTPKSKKLVIVAQPNHDRLHYKRRGQQSVLPAQNDVDVDIKSTAPVTYGLTVPKQQEVEERRDDEQDKDTDEQSAPPKKSEDEIALDALMGKASSNRTIPAITEEEAYGRDINEAQNAPTLEEYMAIPVSEFGAACLRGMGWKDTETLNGQESKSMLKPRILDRRPALLGVGAKASSAVGFEIGEWGKAAKGKKVEGYSPVVLKNKITGEVKTEQELAELTGTTVQGSTTDEIVFDRDADKDTRRRDGDKYHRRERDEDRDSRRQIESGRYRDSKGDSRSDRRDRRSPSRERERKDKRRRRDSRSRSRDRYKSDRYSKSDDRYYKEKERNRDYDRDRRKERSDRDYDSSSRRRT